MKFLIVVPSFNQVKFLQQCLDSILGQGVDVEIFVKDGGSTDGSIKLLKKYGQKISWESGRDEGQTDAINIGIEHFQEEIVDDENWIFAYLNSDDFYLPSALEQVESVFENNKNAKWLVGDACIVNEQGREIQAAIRVYKKACRWLWERLPWLIYVLNPLPQPAVFVRWPAVAKIGQLKTNLNYVMDYEYWLRLFRQFGRPIFANKTLAAFRIHRQSKSATQFNQQFREELQVAKKFSNSILQIKLHQIHNWLILQTYHRIKRTDE